MSAQHEALTQFNTVAEALERCRRLRGSFDWQRPEYDAIGRVEAECIRRLHHFSAEIARYAPATRGHITTVGHGAAACH